MDKIVMEDNLGPEQDNIVPAPFYSTNIPGDDFHELLS